MIPINATVVAAKQQLSCELSGEAVILNLQSGMYYGLNAVAARVWDLLREPRTVFEVRNTVLAEYNVDEERWNRELMSLLEEFATKGLIELKNAA